MTLIYDLAKEQEELGNELFFRELAPALQLFDLCTYDFDRNDVIVYFLKWIAKNHLEKIKNSKKVIDSWRENIKANPRKYNSYSDEELCQQRKKIINLSIIFSPYHIHRNKDLLTHTNPKIRGQAKAALNLKKDLEGFEEDINYELKQLSDYLTEYLKIKQTQPDSYTKEKFKLEVAGRFLVTFLPTILKEKDGKIELLLPRKFIKKILTLSQNQLLLTIRELEDIKFCKKEATYLHAYLHIEDVKLFLDKLQF